MPQPAFYYELLDPDAVYPKDYHLIDPDSSKLVSCTLLKVDPVSYTHLDVYKRQPMC